MIKEEKYIKNKNLITTEYLTQLRDYIKNHTAEFCAKENEAVSWGDFDLFKTIKTDREHLIMKGEICVIDREWEGVHSYVICQFYGDCRKVKDLFKVVAIGELNNDWRNGYFLLPTFNQPTNSTKLKDKDNE